MSLTPEEHKAVQMASELFTYIIDNVMDVEETRQQDASELALHIHGIQNMVLANCAAREYPRNYRMMGETFNG